NGPQVHASAARNPKLLGGPFIDHGGKRVEEIRELQDRTKRERAGLIKFSVALETLDEMLRTVQDGHSLQQAYALVPDVLRGYVELFYDAQDHASFRLVEPLLYRSRLYQRSSQSLMLSPATGDDRPFVLSTPRLPSPGALHLRWSFDDPRVDRLFALKTMPRSLDQIRRDLELSDAEAATFATFLTPEAPAPYEAYTGSGVRWRYFGHACILIETRWLTILLDPVLSYTYESTIARYTYADLPEHIDYVLITHNHQDHIL